MTALTVSLFIFGYGWRRGQGRISRYDGAILLTAYIAYMAYLIITMI
jgi:cation:H+ antiporter